MVITTINPSEIVVINQLSYLGGPHIDRGTKNSGDLRLQDLTTMAYLGPSEPENTAVAGLVGGAISAS